MTTVAVLGNALRRAAHAWRAILGMHLAGLALAIVLGSILHGAIASSLSTSLAGERMRTSFDPYWYNSFSAQATGVAASFRPSVTGAGASFDALDAFFDGFLALLFGPGIGVLPAALAYLALWSFASGGFIALGAGRTKHGVFSAAAQHFPGILLISLAGLAAFAATLGMLRFRLDAAVEASLRDEIDERVRFAWILGEYLVIWMLAWWLRLWFDYAKVAVVTRDAGTSSIASVPRALWAGIAMVTRHPLRTGGVQAGLGMIWLASLAVYVLLVPGAAVSTTTGVVATFVFGQVFILSRAYLRAASYVGAAIAASTFVPTPPASADPDAVPASQEA